MLCPACHTENIDGADVCIECHSDLTDPQLQSDQTRIEEELMRDPMADLIPRDPLKVAPETTVREVIDRLVQTGRNCALVVDKDERMVGIFTERDVLMRIADRYESAADQPVRKFMTLGDTWVVNGEE